MDAFSRCCKLGGKVKVKVIDEETGEKRRVCSGAKSKDPKSGKTKLWGPVAESVPYEPKKKKKSSKPKKK